MSRVALVCSEPIRARMAGIGVRYLEFARRLAGFGLEVALVTAGDPDEVPDLGARPTEVRRLRPGLIGRDLGDCDCVVVQGGLGDLVLAEIGELPAVVDLYDPWLVENLHYVEEVGATAFRRDHASWTLQLSRGDFFLCSSERQRCFYLGWLAAVGRLSPEALAGDPALESLLGLVPFGVPRRLAEHRPVLPPRDEGERRILFGGIYDWLDPWPLLETIETLDRPSWHVLLVRSPNPDTTPQRQWRQVEAWCRERDWWGGRVRAIDWVPAARRFDLFRDVDALVVSHRDGPETWLSLRTRVLDAVAVGCPVIVSDGGETAELLRRHGVGTVVPIGDAPALADELRALLESPRRTAGAGADGAGAGATSRLLDALSWERALEPLVRFCRQPRRHPTSTPVQAGRAARRAGALLRGVRAAVRRRRGGAS